MNRYAELREKHQKEFDKFPMKFAFSDKQFKEAMESLGLTENDTDKIIGIGAGGFIRKSDLKAYTEMCQRTEKEMQEAIDNDKTGEGFIKEMFKYELANHEYCITYELDDTLDALGLTVEEINNNQALKHGLELARKEYLKSYEREDDEEEYEEE